MVWQQSRVRAAPSEELDGKKGRNPAPITSAGPCPQPCSPERGSESSTGALRCCPVPGASLGERMELEREVMELHGGYGRGGEINVLGGSPFQFEGCSDGFMMVSQG